MPIQEGVRGRNPIGDWGGAAVFCRRGLGAGLRTQLDSGVQVSQCNTLLLLGAALQVPSWQGPGKSGAARDPGK